jgi:hypothetical protein
MLLDYIIFDWESRQFLYRGLEMSQLSSTTVRALAPLKSLSPAVAALEPQILVSKQSE